MTDPAIIRRIKHHIALCSCSGTGETDIDGLRGRGWLCNRCAEWRATLTAVQSMHRQAQRDKRALQAVTRYLSCMSGYGSTVEERTIAGTIRRVIASAKRKL